MYTEIFTYKGRTFPAQSETSFLSILEPAAFVITTLPNVTAASWIGPALYRNCKNSSFGFYQS